MTWSELNFEHPWAFALLVLAPLVIVVALRSYAYMGKGRRLASAGVRVLALGALATALALPVVPEKDRRLCRAVAVDDSISVPDEALARALAYVRAVDEARSPDDFLAVLSFGARPVYLAPERWESILRDQGAKPGPDSEETDLLSASTYARSLMPEDCTHALVIVTDGNDTVREQDGLVAGMAALGIPVDVVPATGEKPVETIVEDLHVPARVRTGRPFHARATVFASAPANGVEVVLSHTGPSGVEEEVERRTVDLAEGKVTLSFATSVTREGEHLFGVTVAPAGGDAFAQNNFYEAATEATGPPLILYVEGQPSKGGPLASALEASGFKVVLTGPSGMPSGAADLADYTAVFLSDVPSGKLGGGKVAAIKTYVGQGGLFVFAGGKDSYQMGGYRGSAMEPFLPVSLDVPTDVEKTSAAVILVIDTSGSMAGAPISMAREAAMASVAVLAPDDLVEVIAFDSKPKRLFMMQKAKNQMMIDSFISKLRSGGGTDIVKALDLAYKDLSPVQAKKKHIVLLTDGQSATSGIDPILQNASSEGITISTIGLGTSVNQAFLEKIANATGGKASFTTNPGNLPRLFMREMRLVTPPAVVEGVLKVKVAKKAPFIAKSGASFPYLRGYNLTTPRPGSASPVLVSDRGDPVLAMWKKGQGWCVAFTSDVKARWAAPWVGWDGYARFWNALVRSLAKEEEKSEEVHNIEFERQGRNVTATVDLVDRETGSFIDGMTGTLEMRPFGSDQTQSTDMAQVAPGRYQGEFLAGDYGTYLARVDFVQSQAATEPAAGSLNLPYPPEYRRMGVEEHLVRRIASATGGRVDPAPEDVWLDETEQSAPLALWPWALVAFLVLLPLDIVTRRLNFR